MRAIESCPRSTALRGALLAAALCLTALCCLVSIGAAQEITGSATPASPAATTATAGAPTVVADSGSPGASPRARGLRPPKVTVSAKAHERAADLTNEAQAHYDAGRYEEASAAYRQAYAVVPAPELLFNLGQCQRLLGRSARAVKYFEAYLRLRPNAPHRPLVEQLIEENKLLGPAEPARTSTPPEAQAISAAPAPAESKPQDDPRAHSNSHVMPLPPPEPLREIPPPVRLLADDRYSDHESTAVYERWWFWTAIAVVVAGAAVTTYAVASQQDDSEPETMTTLGMIAWD